ncbi:MAG TPA: peptidoglycan-binding domain-containing protein [Chthoniobacterales bacterium]|jgi:peptidoglycan hydrolase-like protein with peptidoglycan-binding domain|nr:peptidoglycan-binding domain-containing protein [Chthoniobacterales bacterium]
MKLRVAALALLATVAISVRADDLIHNVQQSLKDEGYYFGEVTGTKDADTTAAIRRYQIRNGLQISGDLNDETLKSLGVDASGVHAVVKASPTTAPQPAESQERPELREEQRESSTPTNPMTGQPFPDQQDRQPPVPLDEDAAPIVPGGHFAGTPYANSSREVQHDVILSAQNILARQGLYRGAFNGAAGPDLEFSLRAYQARVRLPTTGRLDLETLAALQLLPGSHAPIYRAHRGRRDEPVRGEWIRDR